MSARGDLLAVLDRIAVALERIAVAVESPPGAALTAGEIEMGDGARHRPRQGEQ